MIRRSTDKQSILLSSLDTMAINKYSIRLFTIRKHSYPASAVDVKSKAWLSRLSSGITSFIIDRSKALAATLSMQGVLGEEHREGEAPRIH